MSKVWQRALLSLVALALSCGGGSKSTAPEVNAVSMVIISDGTLNLSLGGKSYTAAGVYSISPSSGANAVSGTFSGSTLAVGFTTLSGDVGVQPGSVKSTLGPSIGDDLCQANYQSFAQGPKNVRVTFNVIKNGTGICQ